MNARIENGNAEKRVFFVDFHLIRCHAICTGWIWNVKNIEC